MTDFVANAAKGALRTSFVRTLVPLLVGWVVSIAARHGFDVNDDQAASSITAGGAFLYYAAARYLETHAGSKFGWLLGDKKQPVYSSPLPLINESRPGSSAI